MNDDQERFYVSLDGSFDWKLPSEKLKGDKDCTDMPPKVFEAFMLNVYKKKWQPTAALNVAGQD